jgi:hypothetical protein
MEDMTNGYTPLNNISDWLSFLNERIASYEASQNSYLTLVEVIFALIIAMIGIMGTNLIITGGSLPFLIAQAIFIIGLIVIGGLIFFKYIKEKDTPELPYQQALHIRADILKGNLTDPNDICQQCIDAHILL